MTQIVFLVATLVCVLALIYLAGLYLPKSFDDSPKDQTMNNKDELILLLGDAAKECWEMHQGKKSSEICMRETLNLTSQIPKEEIMEALEDYDLSAENLMVEDISPTAEIVVKYEDNKLYIQNR